MAEYVTLMGAEQVASAGRSMGEAAEVMRTVAHQIDESNRRQREFMDDWLARFTAVLAESSASTESADPPERRPGDCP